MGISVDIICVFLSIMLEFVENVLFNYQIPFGITINAFIKYALMAARELIRSGLTINYRRKGELIRSGLPINYRRKAELIRSARRNLKFYKK